MEIYDSEEAQVDAIKSWWKENAISIVLGLGVGIAIILGWNFWQSYNKTKNEQASAQFSQLLKAVNDNNDKSAEKLAMLTQEQYKSTAYSNYSALFEAELKVKQGELAAAKQVLEKLSESSDKDMGNLARVRLVRLMLAAGEFEQALQLINKVDPATSANFAAGYDELVGDIYVALDRRDEARTAYQNAKRKGAQSALLQLKLDDLTAPETLSNTN